MRICFWQKFNREAFLTSLLREYALEKTRKETNQDVSRNLFMRGRMFGIEIALYRRWSYSLIRIRHTWSFWNKEDNKQGATKTNSWRRNWTDFVELIPIPYLHRCYNGQQLEIFLSQHQHCRRYSLEAICKQLEETRTRLTIREDDGKDNIHNPIHRDTEWQ